MSKRIAKLRINMKIELRLRASLFELFELQQMKRAGNQQLDMRLHILLDRLPSGL